ncbi:MAG: hypothetical protein ACREIT_12295, partial [Tepidisphaeraceae bacterium]
GGVSALLGEWSRLRADPSRGRPSGGSAIAVGLLVLCAWAAFLACKNLKRVAGSVADTERGFVERMSALKPRTRWVYTDRLVYPFHAGLRVPPPLAVVSLKRRAGGELNDRRLVTLLRQYRPEQILIGDDDLLGPQVRSLLGANYVLAGHEVLDRHQSLWHYVARDLAPAIGAGSTSVTDF